MKMYFNYLSLLRREMLENVNIHLTFPQIIQRIKNYMYSAEDARRHIAQGVEYTEIYVMIEIKARQLDITVTAYHRWISR